MDEFKPGDRVEVIKSSAGHTIGQQGTVVRIESAVILVNLDKQTELPNDVTIIDVTDADIRRQAAFQSNELRHVTPPSA